MMLDTGMMGMLDSDVGRNSGCNIAVASEVVRSWKLNVEGGYHVAGFRDDNVLD